MTPGGCAGWASLDRTPFKKLLVVRALRPDRVTVGLADFIRKTLQARASRSATAPATA